MITFREIEENDKINISNIITQNLASTQIVTRGKVHDAVNESRKLKSEIPLKGFDNIPIEHEIEFAINLLAK